MKLEVGMYVRFITGFEIKINKPIVRIGKIENINNSCITINVFFRQIIISLKEFDELKRKEPSHNIIDLIEVGDYVNGYKVEEVNQYEVVLELVGCFSEEFYSETIPINDIKSIVTKEQFESMSYRVEE